VSKPQKYQLTEENRALAIEKGLVSATWYTTPIEREKLREILIRRDGPAARDTLLWFALLITSGACGFLLWGSWWAIIPFAIYGVLYSSSSNARWHEAGHGTAFKTDWMNNVLYEISSFMSMFESTLWRWSHARHHSDTIVVGHDPEIAVPRPPDIKGMLLDIFFLNGGPRVLGRTVTHACGKLADDERSFIPENEQPKVIFTARIYLLIYAATIGLSVALGTILPLMYIGLPNFYGAWLIVIYAMTQHAGLAENVVDHRLNCRTVYMNPIHRYLYWNMNYHLEHHMFPLVPYHALPKLHELIKHDSPPPYNGLLETFREIIPTVLRQVKEPAYFVKRKLPVGAGQLSINKATPVADTPKSLSEESWVEVGQTSDLRREDVMRYDHGDKTYAVYRTADDAYYATDGLCTHGRTHLADGLVKGDLIECPKHNGRFDIRDGSPQRRPVCVGLQTYRVKINGDKILVDLSSQHDADD
jgi:Na+-transporting NADH:ubiquinone oxidoreductase subunit F